MSNKKGEVLKKAFYEWAEESLPCAHVDAFLEIYRSKTGKSAMTQVSLAEFEREKKEILSMLDIS